MKIIISHDIDHLYWSEHLFKDLYIPKYLVKSIWSGLRGAISLSSFKTRLLALKDGKMHRLEALMDHNKRLGIPATFFVGMANGLGLSYDDTQARQIIQWIKQEGFEVGVHGIAFNDQLVIKKEYDQFAKIIATPFGIRNHYLRMSAQTLTFQSKAGYAFGSTSYGLYAPYKIGAMWEFPISIMDVYLLSTNQSNDLEAVKQKCLELIEAAETANLPYFNILFHDVYFSSVWEDFEAWYIWVTGQLSQMGYEFISFGAARAELEKIDMNLERDLK